MDLEKALAKFETMCPGFHDHRIYPLEQEGVEGLTLEARNSDWTFKKLSFSFPSDIPFPLDSIREEVYTRCLVMALETFRQEPSQPIPASRCQSSYEPVAPGPEAK